MNREKINWNEMRPKVLKALPKLIHFVKRLSKKTTTSLESGYTSDALKPFLFISSKPFKDCYLDRLIILSMLERKQLPVE